jgi:hypothetical protein
VGQVFNEQQLQGDQLAQLVHALQLTHVVPAEEGNSQTRQVAAAAAAAARVVPVALSWQASRAQFSMNDVCAIVHMTLAVVGGTLGTHVDSLLVKISAGHASSLGA